MSLGSLGVLGDSRTNPKNSPVLPGLRAVRRADLKSLFAGNALQVTAGP